MQPNNRPQSTQTPQSSNQKRGNPPEHVIVSAVTTSQPRARPPLHAVAVDALRRSPLMKQLSPLLHSALQRISDLALRAQAKLRDQAPPA